MREIKCRGIATCDVLETVKKGDMIFGQIVYEGGHPFIVGPVVETDNEYISLESWCPVEPQTVGQFTGLKDKNGKEIYEGDVVRVVAASVASLASIQRVMWQEFRGCWAVGGDLYNNDLWKYVQNGGTCEVIGNIFEGPIEE